MIMCFTACGNEQKENPYGEIVEKLGDNDAYALLEMNYENNVLVTTDMVYDEGHESQAAVYCTVYYEVNDEAKELGTIMSDGTAYPISFSKDGIYAASGNSVEKYAISEKDGTLYLEKGSYGEQEYQKLLEEYSTSCIIHFAYGVSDGCYNSIPD
jgi:hypothetical protein